MQKILDDRAMFAGDKDFKRKMQENPVAFMDLIVPLMRLPY